MRLLSGASLLTWLIAAVSLSACRLGDDSEIKDVTSRGPSMLPPSSFPRLSLRSIVAGKVCLSRVSYVNTNIFPNLNSGSIKDKEEASTFQVDESNRRVNAYWMAAASQLAYDNAANVTKELRTYWGAKDVTFLDAKQKRPALDVQAYIADIPHNAQYDVPARQVDVGFTTVDEPARMSVGDMTLVAFRGTEAKILADIHTDLRNKAVPFVVGSTTLGRVHQGFLESLDSVWSELIAEAKRTKRPIWVTGHSLGAGIATLFAARVMAMNDPDLRMAGLYTYGSPRVGLKDFMDAFNGLAQSQHLTLRRYVNRNDIVVQVPETVSSLITNPLDTILKGGWKHIGLANGDQDTLVWYANNRTPYSNAEALARMSTNVWATNVGSSWIKDHHAANYVYKTELDAFGTRSACAQDHDPQELD